MFNIDDKIQEFLQKRNDWRERVIKACVDCGYPDVNIREWVHARSGNEHYPTEVRSGEIVLAQMWVEGIEVGSFKTDDDYTIRFFAKPMWPEVAERFRLCGLTDHTPPTGP